jgi:hypothetical protein
MYSIFSLKCRFIWKLSITILIVGLVIIACSNENRISPILPDEKTEFNADKDSINIVNYDTTIQNCQSVDENYGYHRQVSPFMPILAFQEMEDTANQILGAEPLPAGQILWLFGKPEGIAETNPPLVKFAFLATRDTISPDDITVILDSDEISTEIQYCVNFDKKRNASYFMGIFKPEGYLNPTLQHSVHFSFTLPGGGILSESKSFEVQQDPAMVILDAGFLSDEELEIPLFNKIWTQITIPENVEIGDSLLSSSNWSFTDVYGNPLPPIQEIARISASYYEVTLSDLAPSESLINIIINPSPGIYSQQFTFESPPDYWNNGGGQQYRTLSSGGCDECLQSAIMTGWSTDPPPDGYSFETHLEFNPRCPELPVCEGWVTRDGRSDHYQEPEKIHRPGVWEYILPKNGEYTQYHGNMVSCHHHAVGDPYHWNEDTDVQYMLFGLKDNGQTRCEPIGPFVRYNFGSDTEPPNGIEANWRIILPSSSCGTDAKYILKVAADDNFRIDSHPIFSMVYLDQYGNENDGGEIILDEFPYCEDYDTHFECEYLIDDPDIFACVHYMKIEIYDRKGNMKAYKMDGQSGDVFNSTQLPYPRTISLSFLGRTSLNSDQPVRQYVNLNRKYEYDPSMCIYKNKYPDHGPLIYMEAQILPALPGITVLFDYEDPSFQRPELKSPTNDKNGDVPSTDNNPDLTPLQKAYLWGSHSPYGDDGKELGDNYNYYYNDIMFIPNWIRYLNDHNVPDDDPIRDHFPDVRPCFENPACTGLPEGVYCLDYYCWPHLTPLDTLKSGKVGVYFNTGSHGGDDFKFVASGNLKGKPAPCLKSQPPYKFVVWRRMEYIDYWMNHRNNSLFEYLVLVLCEYQRFEYNGNFKVSDSGRLLEHLQGVFDDAFIEIMSNVEVGETEYSLGICDEESARFYGNVKLGFDGSLPDLVAICGIDHAHNSSSGGDCYCINSVGGMTVVDCDPVLRDFFSYVAIGRLNDIRLNQDRDLLFLDGKWTKSIEEVSLNYAAHELTHNIYQQGFTCTPSLDNLCTYGLMNYIDSRSYLHSSDILRLRSTLGAFDTSEY